MSTFFLRYIVVPSVIVPLIASLYNFTRHSRYSRFIFYFLLVSGLTDVIVSQVGKHGITTLPALHFYTIGEFLFLSCFFSMILTRKGINKVIIAIGLIYLTLAIINMIYFQPITQFNTYTRSLEAFLIIGYCLVYFEQESRIRQAIRWEKKPVNWFIAGMLFYFAGAFFFFLFANVIRKLGNDTQMLLWCLHGVFSIVMNLFFTIGFLNERRNG